MKKQLILLSAFAAISSLSSCKKEYNCKCVSTDLSLQTITTVETVKSRSKTDAKIDCASLSTISLTTTSKACTLE